MRTPPIDGDISIPFTDVIISIHAEEKEAGTVSFILVGASEREVKLLFLTNISVVRKDIFVYADALDGPYIQDSSGSGKGPLGGLIIKNGLLDSCINVCRPILFASLVSTFGHKVRERSVSVGIS